LSSLLLGVMLPPSLMSSVVVLVWPPVSLSLVASSPLSLPLVVSLLPFLLVPAVLPLVVSLLLFLLVPAVLPLMASLLQFLVVSLLPFLLVPAVLPLVVSLLLFLSVPAVLPLVVSLLPFLVLGGQMVLLPFAVPFSDLCRLRSLLISQTPTPLLLLMSPLLLVLDPMSPVGEGDTLLCSHGGGTLSARPLIARMTKA